jgi:hypothetical protein
VSVVELAGTAILCLLPGVLVLTAAVVILALFSALTGNR